MEPQREITTLERWVSIPSQRDRPIVDALGIINEYLNTMERNFPDFYSLDVLQNPSEGASTIPIF